MCAHDAIAQKDFYPHLPDIPIEVDEDEETIKIVQLVKSNEPLVSWIFWILHIHFITLPRAFMEIWSKLKVRHSKCFKFSCCL